MKCFGASDLAKYGLREAQIWPTSKCFTAKFDQTPIRHLHCINWSISWWNDFPLLPCDLNWIFYSKNLIWVHQWWEWGRFDPCEYLETLVMKLTNHLILDQKGWIKKVIMHFLQLCGNSNVSISQGKPIIPFFLAKIEIIFTKIIKL